MVWLFVFALLCLAIVYGPWWLSLPLGVLLVPVGAFVLVDVLAPKGSRDG